MIRTVAMIFILISCYYTFTFGKSLWIDDKNKLGGLGAILMAVLSIIGPVIVVFMVH